MNAKATNMIDRMAADLAEYDCRMEAYDQWLTEVDTAVFERVGCNVDDLDTRSFLLDWYDGGMESSEAAVEAIAQTLRHLC